MGEDCSKSLILTSECSLSNNGKLEKESDASLKFRSLAFLFPSCFVFPLCFFVVVGWVWLWLANFSSVCQILSR